MDGDWFGDNGTFDDPAEWQIVIAEDSVSVQHLCCSADDGGGLRFDADRCAFHCEACGGSLAVRRAGAWGL